MPDDGKLTAETCSETQRNKQIKNICIKTDRKKTSKNPHSLDKKYAQNMMGIKNEFYKAYIGISILSRVPLICTIHHGTHGS